MARRSTRRGRASNSVSVDFTGVDARVLIPEGEYLFECTAVVQDESQSGNDMLVWDFEIADGDLAGQTSKLWTSLKPEALWKLAGLLTALGQEVPDGVMDIDLSEMVGLKMMGVVTHEDYNDRPQSRISDFYPATDEEPEEPKGRGRQAKDEDAEEERGTGRRSRSRREEPEEEPEERSSRRRSRRSEEPEEEPETRSSRRSRRGAKDEDAEEKGGRSRRGRKKQRDPLTEEEVQDMTEDELESLVEEYELDVDFGSAKTLRKKAALVLDALDAEELLDAGK